MSKIGILVTHPIQYYSPFFEELAREFDLMVYYCCKPDKKSQGTGFGVDFEWDVPLLEGYKYEFLANISKIPDVNNYAGCDTPSVKNEIKKGNFDLFIIFGWYYKSARQALDACNKYNVPIYASGDSTLASGSLAVRMLKQAYFRKFLNRFNGFLSPGVRFREYLRFYGVPEKKIIFCPHFINNDFFEKNKIQAAEEKTALREKYGIGKNSIVLLFCGKLIPRKRPFDFLKALKILKDKNIAVKGLIAGDGIFEKKMKAYSNKHKLDAIFLGFQNQTQLPKVYSIADCLMLPSKDSWGLVVNEAFACGIPAIVSNSVGCWPDLIEEGKTGYVYRYGNIDELILKIILLGKAMKNRFDFTAFVNHKIKKYSVKEAAEAIKKIMHG